MFSIVYLVTRRNMTPALHVITTPNSVAAWATWAALVASPKVCNVRLWRGAELVAGHRD